MKYLMEYSYPGNIRELKNMIERMVILSTDKIIGIEDLPLEIKMKSDTVENKTVVGVGPLKDILEQEIYSLADVEKVVIAIALQKQDGINKKHQNFLELEEQLYMKKLENTV